MLVASSRERPPMATSKPSGLVHRSEEEAGAEVVAPTEEPDLFDALWNSDMDTGPERIKRTRVRRPEGRARSGRPLCRMRRDAV
jgi:hypothetical protein